MEKKPIKRNENIVKLSKDHHASLLFCWKIRQGIKQHAAAERIIKYVQYFWEHHFSSHFNEEEEFLFSSFKDEKVLKAIDDHQKIKTFIKGINSHVAENQEDVFLTLANLVDDHVRYEERILFPHLGNKLSEEQLIKIGHQISPKPLTDNYEDTFWIKNKSL